MAFFLTRFSDTSFRMVSLLLAGWRMWKIHINFSFFDMIYVVASNPLEDYGDSMKSLFANLYKHCCGMIHIDFSGGCESQQSA